MISDKAIKNFTAKGWDIIKFFNNQINDSNISISESHRWMADATEILGKVMINRTSKTEFNNVLLDFAKRHSVFSNDSGIFNANLLSVAIRDFKLTVSSYMSESENRHAYPGKSLNGNNKKRVFIVHGTNAEWKERVARFMLQIDLTPIILHEQASSGATIIEKIENFADVAFAVVLLTPDDVGGACKDSLRPRARQNVVAELGYFIGKLGRNRVAALQAGDVEIPSDFNGVVYTPLDNNNGWKIILAKELITAELDVNMEKYFRTIDAPL